MRAPAVLVLALALLAWHTQSASGAETPKGMVMVQGGAFWMGASDEEAKALKDKYSTHRMYHNYKFDWETPKRKIFLKPFYIDRTEVTNRQYQKFVDATGHKAPMGWINGHYKKGYDDFPVLYVTQVDAQDFAQWAGKRLPTEEEWEKAARGPDGRVFPWGDEFDPFKAATADSDMDLIRHGVCNVSTANKTAHAKGDQSFYGAMDMGGNVREWTASSDPEHPAMKVVKGASWLDLNLLARGSHREFVYKYFKSHVIGFRCVKDLE